MLKGELFTTLGRSDRAVEAVRAQPAEVGDGGPAARNDDQVGGGDLARRGGIADQDRRLGREGVEVGEVADARQPDHRDAEGFIRLNALRLRTLGQRKKKLKL